MSLNPTSAIDGNCAITWGCTSTRAVVAQLNQSAATTGEFWENALNWITNYDITTVPWGQQVTGNFDSAAQTTPYNTSSSTAQGITGRALAQWSLGTFGSPLALTGSATFAKSQAILPAGSGYLVIAEGTESPSGNGIIIEGCTGAAPAGMAETIVDLPLPEVSNLSGQWYGVNILMSLVGNRTQIITLSEGENACGLNFPPYGVWDTLADWASGAIAVGLLPNNYGPLWNAAQACANPSGDPFGGDP